MSKVNVLLLLLLGKEQDMVKQDLGRRERRVKESSPFTKIMPVHFLQIRHQEWSD